MHGEATCSLSCIQITFVVFVGALLHRVWKGGWWVDSAASLILGILFGWEGYKTLKWVSDPAFDGGCCGGCKVEKRGTDLEAAEPGSGSCCEKGDCSEDEKAPAYEKVVKVRSAPFVTLSITDPTPKKDTCCSAPTTAGDKKCSKEDPSSKPVRFLDEVELPFEESPNPIPS